MIERYILCEYSPDINNYSFKFFTRDFTYDIGVKVDKDDNPVHIQADYQSRKPRAGETWLRGNDLVEGEYNQDTWLKLITRIVATEMVRVVKKKPEAERTYQDNIDEDYHMPEKISCNKIPLSYSMEKAAKLQGILERSEKIKKTIKARIKEIVIIFATEEICFSLSSVALFTVSSIFF